MTRLGARKTLAAVLLCVLCACAYSPVFTNSFVKLDDDLYILDNRFVKQGLTLSNLSWAFGFQHDFGVYWHPLTWVSMMLDYQLFGSSPTWFHFVNLLLHAGGSVLLLFSLYGMTASLGRSTVVAALFAVHPLNVESVAWAAERKTVLSALFFMLALFAYVRYAKRPTLPRYLLVCASFAIGLLAKSMIVPLPLLLLVLDVWPMRRLDWAGLEGGAKRFPAASRSRLLWEKAPLVCLSISSVVVSMLSLSNWNNLDENNLLPLSNKLSNAVVSIWLYIGKALWPSGLTIFYPVRVTLPAWQVGISVVGLVLVSVGAAARFKKSPWLLVGWVWFLVAIAPVSGIVRAGLWPAMADRFFHFAGIGLFIAGSWGVAELLTRFNAPRWLKFACPAAVLMAFTFVCKKQADYWRDTATLFEHAIDVTEGNSLALVKVGWCRFDAGDKSGGIRLFEQASVIDPMLSDLDFAHGAIEFDAKHYVAAAGWFAKAHSKSPRNLGALFLLGRSYEGVEDYESAAKTYGLVADARGADLGNIRARAAYRLHTIVRPALAVELQHLSEKAAGNPTDSAARLRYAQALDDSGYLDQALVEYAQVSGEDLSVRCRIADIQRRTGHAADAERTYEENLRRDGAHCESALGLGQMYMVNGEWRRAMDVFGRATKDRDTCARAEFNSALSAYLSGKWSSALAQFREVARRHPELEGETARYIARLEEL